jgi:hypothetical protein
VSPSRTRAEPKSIRPILDNGSARFDTSRGQRIGNHRHGVLVRTACPADMAKLQDEEYRRAPSSHDVDMVNLWSAIRCLRNRSAFHHPPHHPTAMLLRTVRRELGAMLNIWSVGAVKMPVVDTTADTLVENGGRGPRRYSCRSFS